MTTQIKSAIDILHQLELAILQMKPEEYSRSSQVLSGNSIGKHVRHILEFYISLIRGYEKGIINYDERERVPEMEVNPEYAIDVMHEISRTLYIYNDRELQLITFYQEEMQYNKTSFLREIIYNIEHSVHHMAIIRIAIVTEGMTVLLPRDFGVAASTIKYQDEACAQ